jgi:hypothetical protein
MASPAHAIAAQMLHGKKTTHGTAIPPERYRQAIAAAGAGPDHAVGEVAVALVDDGISSTKFGDGAIVTDRRLIARGGDVLLDLPYPAIDNAWHSTGVVLDDLQLTAWGRAFKVSGVPDTPALSAFLQTLLRYHPPPHRVPPPRPLVAPSPDDPTGGAAACRSIWSGDVRALPLVGMALEGHQKGWFPAEIGLDHVTRAMHFDRTLAYGRGTHEGWWTSPLGAPDLAYAFARMLGAPLAATQDGSVRTLDFRLTSGGNVGAAAVSSAVGLVALGVLGVGWVSRPGSSSQDIRVKISPGIASSGFALFDGADPLSKTAPGMVASLFQILPRIEGRMLLQRVSFGWEMTPEHLDDVPMDALFHRVAEGIGAIELGIFFPKG